MNHYAIHDADGFVRRYIRVPEQELADNVAEDESALLIDAFPTTAHRVVDGQLVPFEPPKPALTYADERRAAYPAVGEQLDALWKAFAAIDVSLLPQETLAMMQQVKAVKEKYPKV